MKRIPGNQVSSLFTALIKVFKEMESVIREIISNSFADASYPKALKALQTYRAEAIDVFLFRTILNVA
jgi:Ku C terminal domain like